ncbi:MAG TPA: protein kinase, partial [Dehalococcoidia bacterium]|nr:protein kinase [Dehalococcoidia bacterium]
KAEIENWRKLDHDNITKFLDYNVYPVYLEMELCNGSLAKIGKPLMVERAAFIILEISRGLSHAHKKKIFHTDLKPSNILLLDDVPKISDWGLSKVQSEDGSSLAGSFSPQYAAPEQYSPEIFGKEDERTDIFQLGTIFYQLVTDKLPFRGDHLTQIKNAIIAESPRPPSEINPEAADVEPFILKCLEKKKQDRYQNLSELQDDLANFLGDDFEKSLTLSRNTLEKLTLCSALIEVFAAQKNAQKCLIYLNNLLAYAVTKEFKEMIKEEIEALEFYSSQGVDCKERIPFLEKIIHRARMGE